MTTLFNNVERLHLCEAEDGLWFFSPMIAGDQEFYTALYRNLRFDRFLAGERYEFALAARHVSAGSTFARQLHDVTYTGIDLSFDDSEAEQLPPNSTIRCQSLDHHLTEGRLYEVVSAFQVLEHVDDPRGFLEKMTRLLGPSGKIIIAVPLAPSPAPEVPAFPINMPPHHLTFWTKAALHRLFSAVGLRVVHYSEVPPSPAEDFLFWSRRFSWIRQGREFARLDRYAVMSMLTGVAAAKLLAGRVNYRRADHRPVNHLIVGQLP